MKNTRGGKYLDFHAPAFPGAATDTYFFMGKNHIYP